MTRADAETIARAGHFIRLTGRVLEQRLYGHHFEGADPAGVRAALEAYRAPDGGFAFGLEPDVRGPAGQPLAVPSALRVLAAAGQLDAGTGGALCDWLASVSGPAGGAPSVLPSLAAYPHPPFLPVPAADTDVPGDLLATGQIAGPLLAHGIAHPWLDGAVAFCWAAIDALDRTHPYEVRAALDFLDHAPDRHRAVRAADRLGRLVREQGLVPSDPSDPTADAAIAPGYAAGEWTYAHDYAPAPDSLAARWFTDRELTRSLDFLAGRQGDDGGWPITYVQWAPNTAMEARPAITLHALHTLTAWD
ncbi:MULTISPECIES: hypothetical protein [Catenuloplanes]|uniref:Prenyltransferase n=1 Tax=Catenuloplanes niger TaxID=587534 RepID=A0AAE3ZWC3_9ACTN|nr:hypothetical protein [Catenuloplanes niger]MDR7326030.1 hypothetical protein [Catenuloplanes niger]